MKEPSKYTCPKCHSENIQTYRLVYTGGVTTTSSGTIGVGIGGGHLGVGAASSSGVNVSQLAETVAPPRKKSWIKKFFIHFFFFLVWRLFSLHASPCCRGSIGRIIRSG